MSPSQLLAVEKGGLVFLYIIIYDNYCTIHVLGKFKSSRYKVLGGYYIYSVFTYIIKIKCILKFSFPHHFGKMFLSGDGGSFFTF